MRLLRDPSITHHTAGTAADHSHRVERPHSGILHTLANLVLVQNAIWPHNLFHSAFRPDSHGEYLSISQRPHLGLQEVLHQLHQDKGTGHQGCRGSRIRKRPLLAGSTDPAQLQLRASPDRRRSGIRGPAPSALRSHFQGRPGESIHSPFQTPDGGDFHRTKATELCSHNRNRVRKVTFLFHSHC
ncbi:MAG: hypothetical protein BWY82_00376 [Verrucomicrobia bacterium ADurb.Bin474]|nr:MAG: hypothetical protein BWY82_00376 [Verrucomicrobia bacterium ADurb.Bin474]